jgi:hypothetical protein
LDSDEGRLNEEIRLAGKAGEVLTSEAFKAAFTSLKAHFWGRCVTQLSQTSGLDLRLLDKYECLHALHDCLRSMVDTG